MRLNEDLIRDILLDLEGEETVDLDQYSKEQLSYHRYQLANSELAEGVTAKGPGNEFIAIDLSLTWEGHKFLDFARNDTVWNKVKAEVAKHGPAVGIAMLFETVKLMALNPSG